MVGCGWWTGLAREGRDRNARKVRERETTDVQNIQAAPASCITNLAQSWRRGLGPHMAVDRAEMAWLQDNRVEAHKYDRTGKGSKGPEVHASPYENLLARSSDFLASLKNLKFNT
jgi:hypothetical protein